MCHSQFPRAFERWIDSMNEFWRLREPLAIQSHYSHPLLRFQTRPHPHLSLHLPFFSSCTCRPITQRLAGIRSGTEALLSPSSAELTNTRIPFIPAMLVVCTQRQLQTLELGRAFGLSIYTLPVYPSLATPSNRPSKRPGKDATR